MVKDVVNNCHEELKKAVESLKQHYHRLRTGRANVGMLDDLRVDYYGTLTPLSQVANLSTPDPKTLAIQPWEPSMLKPIEKAIQASDLGINPMNDGKTIRLGIPTLTGERRKELIKTAKQMLEDCRIGIRNHRRDANEMLDQMEKDKEVSEDDNRRGHEEVQKIHDEYIKTADEVFHVKEKELEEV